MVTLDLACEDAFDVAWCRPNVGTDAKTAMGDIFVMVCETVC